MTLTNQLIDQEFINPPSSLKILLLVKTFNETSAMNDEQRQDECKLCLLTYYCHVQSSSSVLYLSSCAASTFICPNVNKTTTIGKSTFSFSTSTASSSSSSYTKKHYNNSGNNKQYTSNQKYDSRYKQRKYDDQRQQQPLRNEDHQDKPRKEDEHREEEEEGGYMKLEWGLTVEEGQVQIVYGEWGDKFIIINKPFGYPIQSNLNHSVEKLVVTQLLNTYQQLMKEYYHDPTLYKGRFKRRLKNLEEFFERDQPFAYFPNRLDKWTSGLVVVSLTSQVCAILSQSMPRWKKKYRVVTDTPRCMASDMSEITIINNYNKNNNQTKKKKSSSEDQTTNTNISSSSSSCSTNRACCMISKYIGPQEEGGPIMCNGSTSLFKSGEITSYMSQRTQPAPIFNRNQQILLEQQQNLGLMDEASITTIRDGIDKKENNSFKCQSCADNQVVYQMNHPFLSHYLVHGSSIGKGINKFGPRYAKSEFELKGFGAGKALFEVALHTGRTHQIRVHMSESGFPIVGDPYYNPYFIDRVIQSNIKNIKDKEKESQQLNNDEDDDSEISRLYLQSYYLEFIHPTSQQPEVVTLDFPDSWKPVIEKIKLI
ncbi:hypothetical protein DFA_07884 [Cavenderia fasciculata]|uniref:Pseudouridine synthase RsuA/RluA-like domain-containing protein n=1 Tax=Cavenderia fasciculata TaxID=261658 RepID=F4Q3T7_CACFS|nr:uncharacterized protein DFA_07884 [Cavenderia fasciculata]EGG16903.1 hypothetical protein DFA_07884 [Cavenderia fasciculata]|eukprot:XP_004355377.1 hypothetical protein DFA_07884 [Cavenderia fasciculata]